jgi:hypothetical protein
MAYGFLADLVLLAHLLFLLFVVLGGLLLFRRPRVAWLHIPCAVWGILTEYAGIVCPLTPLENALRHRGGETGFAGGFIEHYITAALYPAGLSRGVQVALGTFAVAVNVLVYWRLLVRRAASRGTGSLS